MVKDRILSIVDPQMRVGHKSQRRSWAGYKVHVTEEPDSELITQMGLHPANEHDPTPLPTAMAAPRIYRPWNLRAVA